MTLERGLDVVLIGRVSIQHAVLSDQAAGAFGQKDLVAELDRLLSLAALDQVGVALKNGVDFLIRRDLLAIQHAAASLIDDAVAQLAIVLDVFAEGLDGQVIEWRFATGLLSLLEHAAGIGNDPLADADEPVATP